MSFVYTSLTLQCTVNLSLEGILVRSLSLLTALGQQTKHGSDFFKTSKVYPLQRGCAIFTVGRLGKFLCKIGQSLQLPTGNDWLRIAKSMSRLTRIGSLATIYETPVLIFLIVILGKIIIDQWQGVTIVQDFN